jgi:alpha-D-ribose 1-methylphosphonate 5-triphosphate synthase subunit PhnI
VSERHTFVGEYRAGRVPVQVMVEEFVAEDGSREVNVAFRGHPNAVWGPPVRMEQTS